MVNEQLVGLLQTILGEGKPTARGNYAFYCKNCKHHKPKLEVSCVVTQDNKNPFHCWACDVRGTTIKSLFKTFKVSSEKYEELNTILGTSYKHSKEELKRELPQIELPKEFQPFINLQKTNIIGRHALTYLLKERKISFEDIIKINAGYCETGRYKNKIIIPSYSKDGKLDYFVARSFNGFGSKLDAPQSDKNIVGFESLINYNLPITLCEGVFDAISIKRNAIPLFGKSIPPKLKEKLMLNRVKTIYLALDEDALKSTFKIAEELLQAGKELYVIRLGGKDPNEIGFLKYNELVSVSKPFTYSDLVRLKMEIR